MAKHLFIFLNFDKFPQTLEICEQFLNFIQVFGNKQSLINCNLQ
jgi:hypothetical protein